MHEELIERLEAAAEGSRELDAAVLVAAGILRPIELPGAPSGAVFHRAHGGSDIVVHLSEWWRGSPAGFEPHAVEPVTASLDAALATLKPEWVWELDFNAHSTPRAPYCATIYLSLRDDRQHNGEAATPALALAAACLKARAS